MTFQEKMSSMSNSTRTAVALAVGLAVSFATLLAITVLPGILPSFDEAYRYSIHNPGSLAIGNLLLLFAALAGMSFLNDWKQSFSTTLQCAVLGAVLVCLAITIVVLIYSVMPPRARQDNMLTLFSLVAFIVTGGLICMVSSLLAHPGTSTPYMVINAIGAVGPLPLLVFDGTSASVAFTLGVWFTMYFLPSTQPASEVNLEKSEDGVNLGKAAVAK